MELSRLSRSFPPCVEEATPVRRHLVHMIVAQSTYIHNTVFFPVQAEIVNSRL